MGIKTTHRHVFFRVSIALLVLLFLLPSYPGQQYYADITITVDSSGFVTIEGLTNYPNLTIKNTEEYTSKQQSFWLLNITKQDRFSEFVYELILPKGASINYIKSSGFLQIEEKLGYLTIRGFGENESLSVLVQYQIEKKAGSFLYDTIVYLILIPTVIIVSIFVLLLSYKEKNKKTEKKSDTTFLRDAKGLNSRQKQIIRLLQQTNMPVTQTDIQKELQIPKASVSRNIHGLERKGLIEKEQIGMSNLIRLKKSE